jgi:hypothetical protein
MSASRELQIRVIGSQCEVLVVAPVGAIFAAMDDARAGLGRLLRQKPAASTLGIEIGPELNKGGECDFHHHHG